MPAHDSINDNRVSLVHPRVDRAPVACRTRPQQRHVWLARRPAAAPATAALAPTAASAPVAASPTIASIATTTRSAPCEHCARRLAPALPSRLPWWCLRCRWSPAQLAAALLRAGLITAAKLRDSAARGAASATKAACGGAAFARPALLAAVLLLAAVVHTAAVAGTLLFHPPALFGLRCEGVGALYCGGRKASTAAAAAMRIAAQEEGTWVLAAITMRVLAAITKRGSEQGGEPKRKGSGGEGGRDASQGRSVAGCEFESAHPPSPRSDGIHM